MINYLLRRSLYMIFVTILISMLAFIIINLPPGDFVDDMISARQTSGETLTSEEIEALRRRYGLDKSVYLQYFSWIKMIITRGDFGYSFQWNEPVRDLIGERIGLTIVISLSTMIFTFIIAIPIGIYSALRQYTVFDFFFTFIAFIGMATPNFLFALILMFVSSQYLDISVGGLFSPEQLYEPWSWVKFVDLMRNIWIPIIVVGTAGTAGQVRVMRGQMLDELGKHYVITARAKGLSEAKVILKHALKVAVNPLLSSAGFLLPQIVSGAVITAVVLGLPTTGPLLLSALQNQDMYLAGTFILLLAILTQIGTMLSDILLALFDPRIRYD